MSVILLLFQLLVSHSFAQRAAVTPPGASCLMFFKFSKEDVVKQIFREARKQGLGVRFEAVENGRRIQREGVIEYTVNSGMFGPVPAYAYLLPGEQRYFADLQDVDLNSIQTFTIASPPLTPREIAIMKVVEISYADRRELQLRVQRPDGALLTLKGFFKITLDADGVRRIRVMDGLGTSQGFVLDQVDTMNGYQSGQRAIWSLE